MFVVLLAGTLEMHYSRLFLFNKCVCGACFAIVAITYGVVFDICMYSLWPSGQELSPLGFAAFYLEFAKELVACKICVEKYPPSEFMVMKGTRLQELQQLSGEALLKEATCTAHQHSMPLYMFAETGRDPHPHTQATASRLHMHIQWPMPHT